MWPDRVSNPGPLNYESGALLTALRGPAIIKGKLVNLIERIFKREGSLSSASDDMNSFTSDAVRNYNLWSSNEV